MWVPSIVRVKIGWERWNNRRLNTSTARVPAAARVEALVAHTRTYRIVVVVVVFLTLALAHKRWGARGLKTRHTRPHEETKKIGYKNHSEEETK